MADYSARNIRLRPTGVRLGTPSLIAPPAPRRYGSGAASDLIGAGVARLAEGVGKVVDAFDRQQEQEERLTAARWRAEDSTQWAERFQKAQETAPLGADGFTKSFLEQFDQFAGERLDAAASPRQRQEVELGLLRLRGSLAQEALSFEAGSRLAKKQGDVAEIVRLNGNAVARDIGRFDSLLAETEGAILSAGLPAAVADKQTRAARQQFAEAGLMGLANRDPAAAMVSVRSGNWDRYVDPDRLVRLYDHAETEDKRRRAESRREAAESRALARAEVEPLLRDELTAYGRGDAFDGAVPDSRILAAYGPERGKVLVEERSAARRLSADIKSVGMVPPDVQDRLLASYRPDGPGYAGEAERFDTLARAVAKDREARKDPAQYVIDRSPTLRALVGRANEEPEAGARALSLSMDLQAQAGIPEAARRVLPQAMAENTVKRLLSLPAEATADGMETIAKGFGDRWPKVFRELVQEKLPEGFQVLATVEHPMARKELAEAQAVGREKLHQAAGKNAKAVDDGVRAAMEPLIQSLALQPGGGGKIALWEDQTRLLAYRYALSMPAADAAKKAADEIVVGKYDFVPQDGGLQVRAPKGQGDRAAAHARQLLDTLRPEELPDIGGNTTLSPEDRRDILLSSVRRGVWVNNEHDDGWVLLDARRQPVTRADGRRIEFRFADVKEWTPAPPVPVPPIGLQRFDDNGNWLGGL